MANVPFMLSELSEADVDWLTGHGQKRSVPVGTLLIEQGKPIEWIYIVLEGRFSLYGAAGSGAIGLGEMIGEMSFVDTNPPSADVVASEDSKVLAVERRALAAQFEKDPAFAARFFRAIAVLLAERLRDAGAVASGRQRPLKEMMGQGAEAAVTAWHRLGRMMEQLGS
jgi:CRP-like cAMP-binding protein